MILAIRSASYHNLLSIPVARSVMGYDDNYGYSLFRPLLTTVLLDVDLQGKEAVRRILTVKCSVRR